MLNKPNNNKQCRSDCQDHIFQLKPLNPFLHYKNTTVVQFCPKINSKGTFKHNIYPQYNFDKDYRESGFFLSIDKIQSISNQKMDYMNQISVDDIEKKKKNEIPQNSGEIYIAKPNKKDKHCGVCKINYEDYFYHTENINHKQNIRNNKYNHYLIQVSAKLFGNQLKQPNTTTKNYQPYTSYQNNNFLSTINFAQFEPPTRKRVKLQDPQLQILRNSNKMHIPFQIPQCYNMKISEGMDIPTCFRLSAQIFSDTFHNIFQFMPRTKFFMSNNKSFIMIPQVQSIKKNKGKQSIIN